MSFINNLHIQITNVFIFKSTDEPHYTKNVHDMCYFVCWDIKRLKKRLAFLLSLAYYLCSFIRIQEKSLRYSTNDQICLDYLNVVPQEGGDICTLLAESHW